MDIMWRAVYHNCRNPSHAIHDASCTWDSPFGCHSPQHILWPHSLPCHMWYILQLRVLYIVLISVCVRDPRWLDWSFLSTFTEKMWKATVHLVMSSHPSIHLSTQNSTIPTGWTARNLTCKRPTFTYANTCKKNTHKIHFIYFGNKEIYCILRHAA